MTNIIKQETKTSKECDADCGTCSTSDSCNDQRAQQYKQEQQLKSNLSQIKHKIAIISGKGGVGKSTVTANLAMAFAMQGNKVGVLDADIHGPCIPKMLGLKGQKLIGSPDGQLLPVTGRLGIKVASVDFLLKNDETPVIWRGPLKMRLIQQFLSDIAWSDLDFLFVDLPPGTGDEPLSVMQLIPDMDGVIIVTLPSEVSESVVKKSVTFAKQVGVPVIGIIENMSGFVCPDCGAKIDVFKTGGGKRIAQDMNIPHLGSIPLDSKICNDSDVGLSFIENKTSPASKAFLEIIEKIARFFERDR